MLREQQKMEALKRMDILGLHENVIREFSEGGRVYKSESIGFLYWLNEEEEIAVRDWEMRTGNLVYKTILNDTEFGQLLSMFYVSKKKEEWDEDKEDLKDDMAVVYIKCLLQDMSSELGTIFFQKKNGGLIRIA